MQELDDKKVVLGLSGGVDSAVAAYLLKKEGYEVFGVFLRNWTEDDETGECTAKIDREDAMRVASKLGISFVTVDYEKEYRERVFSFLLKGLSEGLTPNPDILCNPLIKFEALSLIADQLGAKLIATGHYARKITLPTLPYSKGGEESSPPLKVRGGRRGYALGAGLDTEKDQSYFLSRITPDQLKRSLFPIGVYTKKQVREIAGEIGLHLAKKESTSGICFIGERNFVDFIKQRVPAEKGPIITTDGKVVGEHTGLPFYTIGQRHGFGHAKSGGIPYYVCEKRFKDNTLVIAPAYDNALFKKEITVVFPHWISGTPEFPLSCSCRIRYRQPLQDCKVLQKTGEKDKLKIVFNDAQRAATPGQYAVFYTGEICLGSAMISQ
jgi:tRNA-uridine 2-sulfurtransferase